MDKRLEDLIEWLNGREERERIAILVIACIGFAILWYWLLEKPLILKRMAIHQQILGVQKQTLFFGTEANNIVIHHTMVRQQEKSNQIEKAKYQPLYFASPEGNNDLVKTLLTPAKHIKIMDLKSVATVVAPPSTKPEVAPKAPPVEHDGFQIMFESDYLNTIAYLNTLEKLPWCLSWDSLEYMVTTYPTASVVVTLHIVSA